MEGVVQQRVSILVLFCPIDQLLPAPPPGGLSPTLRLHHQYNRLVIFFLA